MNLKIFYKQYQNSFKVCEITLCYILNRLYMDIKRKKQVLLQNINVEVNITKSFLYNIA